MSTPSAAFGTPPGPRGRSRAGYWIAAGILVVTVVAAVALGVTRFVDTLTTPDNYPRSVVPGTVVLHVGDPGERIIYSEGSQLALAALDVTVTGPGGADVTVHPYDTGDVTYDTSGHSGRAVGKFDASDTGDYRISATGENEPQGGAFAVGTDLFKDLVGIFLGPAIVFAIGLALAVTIFVVTIIGRRRRPEEDAGIGIG